MMPEIKNHKITVEIEFDVQGVNPIGSIMDIIAARIDAIPGGNVASQWDARAMGSEISPPKIIHAEFRRILCQMLSTLLLMTVMQILAG